MKTIFKEGTFTNFRGEKQNYVVAVVQDKIDYLEVWDGNSDEPLELTNKILKVGIAICNPKDNFNPEIGRKMAEGRAIKFFNRTMFATKNGMLNETLANALAESTAEALEANPTQFSESYKADYYRWLRDTKQ